MIDGRGAKPAMYNLSGIPVASVKFTSKLRAIAFAMCLRSVGEDVLNRELAVGTQAALKA